MGGTSAPAMTQDASVILGLESSCDETAAAILRRYPDGRAEVVAERVASQNDAHANFGGVVPEIAARAHADRMDGLVKEVIDEFEPGWEGIDVIAATSGPGLIGGVLVGMMTGKALALARGLPFIAVNHLEGHALSPRLAEPVAFPYLLLLVSGGHCQFLAVNGVGDYTRLGSTIDDAAGEAFDKTAKLLGLGFPGGPAVEKAAQKGDAKAVDLPRPLLNRKDTLDMSFAGLKTAVRRAAELEQPLTDRRAFDICASFQTAVCDILTKRSQQAMDVFLKTVEDAQPSFVVAGGVAANASLRKSLETAAADKGFAFVSPPMKWCTDNAAMIALAGAERFVCGMTDELDVPARARWPLDDKAAWTSPISGAGKKGAKV